MEQELLLKAQFLQQQAQEIEQNLEIIIQEIESLKKMHEDIDFLVKSKEKSAISTIGKGLHLKTQIESKELFVEVGADVVVKKSPEEAKKVIENQINKLTEAKTHMSGKLDIYHQTLETVIKDIQSKEKEKNQEVKK